ncbi:MAG: sucrose-specific PTS transporter subunit IIBC [Lachnospiraceae bacterium]|nr:sucrose-specific PTS transporter subunit IIBC [Lachnospiraceae bacterium]
MDYKKSAEQIYELIGGKENLVSGAHCATRLRLVVVDDKKCDKMKIENVDGVKGVFIASGQLQIILGTGTVNKVFDEFTKIANITGSSKEEVKQIAAAKQNWFKRAIKTLGDIFVPIIPAIVASGLLMGLLEGLSKLWPAMTASGTYTIIHLFSNAAFVFLPILIAVSAAKVFGGNIYLGAVVGMIMIHPDLLNAWAVASAEKIPTATAWFGLYDINLTGYQGHVIPVIIAVWFMSFLEKKLHKIVPEMFDLFVTPLVTVLVTGYFTLTIFGPIFSGIESAVLNGMQYLITIPFGIGAFLAGAVYAPTVVSGVHHMYNALEAGLLSSTGINIWMPIATAANVAQGGAALAVAFKTKNRKTKALALPASLSAFLGITEPAIFGVNLRYMKPFVAGIIGGAVGAMFGSIMGIGATAYGITGIFGILITTKYITSYIIMMLISSGIAFAISWLLYKEERVDNIEITEEAKKKEKVETILGSYLNGTAVLLNEVADQTFASGVLGSGVAIIPSDGKLVAPCDGTIEMVYETKHAIGMITETGIEILLHVGLNTVELEGKYYTANVKNGEKVKMGDVLLEFDMEEIKKAGYDLTTPMIITNSDNYDSIITNKTGAITQGEAIVTVK